LLAAVSMQPYSAAGHEPSSNDAAGSYAPPPKRLSVQPPWMQLPSSTTAKDLKLRADDDVQP